MDFGDAADGSEVTPEVGDMQIAALAHDDGPRVWPRRDLPWQQCCAGLREMLQVLPPFDARSGTAGEARPCLRSGKIEQSAAQAMLRETFGEDGPAVAIIGADLESLVEVKLNAIAI